MIITNDHIRFADIKNHFFFSDHSSEKLYRRNGHVPIVHFATNFQMKSPDLWDHEKKICSFRTTQKMLKKTPKQDVFVIRFSFEQTNKKNDPMSENFPSLDNVDAKNLRFFDYYYFFFVFVKTFELRLNQLK